MPIKMKKSSMKYKDSSGNMQDVGLPIGGVETDATLTKSGVSADAKAVGDNFKQLSEQNSDLENRLETIEKNGVGSGGIAQETDPTVPSWAKQPNKPTYTASEVGALPDTTTIPTKVSQLTNDKNYLTSIPSDVVNHKDDLSKHIVYGVCETAADVAEKTVTVDGNFVLQEGSIIIIKFLEANSIASPTLNVNGTGAKPMYRYGTTAISTATTTSGWIKGCVQMYTYDGTGWVRDYWNNTTYSNASLGCGYATCSTETATAAKTATLSSYSLTAGGIVSVKFANSVLANATLNINSKGAKNIYYKGAKITDGIIRAGDVATFVYSSNYHLIAIDRWEDDIQTLAETKANKTSIPTKISQLTNDSNFVTKDVTDALSGQKADKNNVALYITPEMYGAKGDGSTDDSTAIQQAIDNAGSGNIVYLSRKTYKINTGLQLNHSNRRFKCVGTLLYTGTGAAVTLSSKNIVADIDTITATNGTAVKLSAIDKYVEYNTVNVGRVTASKIGLHMYISACSLVYNQIRMGEINATETGVLIWADGGVANENWYYLGRIGGCSTGIKIHSDSTLDVDGGSGTNTNRFFSGSFEHLKDDATAIVLDRTCGNTFQNIRCEEYYGTKSLLMKGLCSGNNISLSQIYADEIDFTGLEHGSVQNYLRPQILWENMSTWRELGQNARIDWDYGLGFTYDPHLMNHPVLATDFNDYHIKQDGRLIPTTVTVDDASLNGVIMKLSAIYSNLRSMARGFPVTFKFGETNGKILLKDALEKIILDNTDGKYLGKTVIVQWVGTNGDANNPFDFSAYSNNWSIQVLGENPISESDLASKKYATESFVTSKIAEAELSGGDVDLSGYALKTEIPKKTSQLTNDSGFLTQHQDISGKANKSDAETWTFTLSDGSTVTKRVVLA